MPKATSNRIHAEETATPKQRIAAPAIKRTAASAKMVIATSKPKSSPASPVSKQQVLINLLKRSQGASLEVLMEATGWQRHSVHGTMSGVLKKRLGLPIISEYGEQGRRYRITGDRA